MSDPNPHTTQQLGHWHGPGVVELPEYQDADMFAVFERLRWKIYFSDLLPPSGI